MDIASLLPNKENPQKTTGFLYNKIRQGRILKEKANMETPQTTGITYPAQQKEALSKLFIPASLRLPRIYSSESVPE